MEQALREQLLAEAVKEARKGLNAGGIPIGSVMAIDGEIIGRGHNQRIQKGSPTLHAEIDCLENAGRRTAEEYQRAILVSTLSPCDMCSGAILLYKIPTLIVGENRTFQGPEKYVESRGIKTWLMNDPTCIQLMEDFIAANPSLWNEDIGVKD